MAAVPRLTIVADDLTGAMDAAAPLAERGLATWVVADAERNASQTLPPAQVVSINAASRHLPKEDAAQRVRALSSRLLDPGCEILIKKIDSTLRGNAVAETLALLEASGRAAAVVAPAFPRQGRTLVAGVVHVHGVPLAHTELARDTLSPPPAEALHLLFRDAAPQDEVRLVARGASVALSRVGRRQILVVDAASDDDLRSTVRSLSSQLSDTLLVGSAGISEAVAHTCFEAPREALAAPAVREQMVFVVGSRTEQSAQQVRALIESGRARLIAAPAGCVDLSAALGAPEALLVIKAEPGSGADHTDAAEVACRLADAAGTLIERQPIAALVVTGGDTAFAVLRRLGQTTVQVMGNLLPGIPFSRIRFGMRELWLVTKAGGFGARDTLATIAQRLHGAA